MNTTTATEPPVNPSTLRVRRHRERRRERVRLFTVELPGSGSFGRALGGQLSAPRFAGQRAS
jgi:hypothetical protein